MMHRKKILLAPSIGEVRIFFDENLYCTVDREEIKTLVGAGFANGDLCSANLDDLEFGMIAIRYNPVRIDAEAAMRSANRIADYIATCKA